MNTPLLTGIRKQAEVKLPDLAKLINKEFGPPFLPDGYVSANAGKDRFSLSIGNRDVSIDNDGKFLGSGSLVLGGWAKPEESKMPEEEKTSRFNAMLVRIDNEFGTDFSHSKESSLLDKIRKQASRQIIPLRGVGKTPGMLRRISNLQKGVKIKGRTKEDEHSNT